MNFANKTYFKANGKPLFAVGAQVHNSTGYLPETLDRAFQALRMVDANTIEIPVYWEVVEPTEGTFDFSSVRDIWERVRQEGLHLILLWFGTWKNGSAKFAPAWVKRDSNRFPRVQAPDGTGISVLSSHYDTTLQADANAFAALCAFLNKLDPRQETLIGVQVQNECGIMNGPARDYSPAAQEQFSAVLPESLQAALKVHPQSPVSQFWMERGSRCEGWKRAFGTRAEEYFTAYSVASYVGKVAAAGQQHLDILMYTNAWVEIHRLRIPGADYPSGGPAARVLDLWKWAAPNLDLLAPDIYQQTSFDYFQTCADYDREDNPLFVPESGPQEWNSRFLFQAVGKHHSIGHCVFGIESMIEPDGSISPGCVPTMGSLKILSAIAGALPQWKHHRIEVVQQEEFALYQLLQFDRWTAMVRFTTSPATLGFDNKDWNWHDYEHKDYPVDQKQDGRRGRGLVVQTGTDEFIVAGDAFRVWFVPTARLEGEPYGMMCSDFNVVREIAYESVEQGRFDRNGVFQPAIRRNGDEVDFGVWAEADAGAVRVRLWPELNRVEE